MHWGTRQLLVGVGIVFLSSGFTTTLALAQDPYFAPAEETESYSYGTGRFTGPPIHEVEVTPEAPIEKPTVTRKPGPTVNLDIEVELFETEPAYPPATRGQDDLNWPVLSGLFGYDSWRGYPDGGWANFGLHAGLNYGTSLGDFSQQTGIGLQIGGLVGVYDWAGTDYRLQNRTQQTTQGFVTYGLFRNATRDSNWSFAFAQDWMINNNYSVMGEDMTMYQWRGLIGYTLNDEFEVGCWGAWRGKGDTRSVSPFGDVTWQPHQQWNFFLHQKWRESLADTWVWFGVPEQDRLTGGGSLGDYIAGAYATVPISDRIAPYTMVNYMHQSASPGVSGAKEDAWNISVGISFVPRGLAASGTVRGHRWSPKLPVANNGLFLVDASRTY